MPLYYKGKRIREYGASGLFLTDPLQENNFEIHNNPTFEGRVITSFANGYISNAISALPTADNWEIQLKIITGSDVTSPQMIYNGYHPSNERRDVEIAINGGHFTFVCSSNGTSADLINAGGTYTVLPNTAYWIRAKFTGLRYVLQYSTNGTNFEDDISAENSTSVYKNISHDWGGKSLNLVFNGSIDLNECYIKVNNVVAWTQYKYTTKTYTIQQAYLGSQKVFDVQAYAPSYVIGEVANPSVQQIFNGVMTKPGVIQIHCIGGGNPTTWSYLGTNYSGSAAGYIGDAYIAKPCNIRMVVGARQESSLFQISDLTTPDNWLTVIQCNSGYSASASGGGRGAVAPILNGHGYLELLQPPALNVGGNYGDSSGSHHGASVWGGYGTGSVNGYGKLQYLRKYR